MAVYLLWISLFSSLFNMRFQECNWIFKETGLPFAVEVDPLFFSPLKKKEDLIFVTLFSCH